MKYFRITENTNKKGNEKQFNNFPFGVGRWMLNVLEAHIIIYQEPTREHTQWLPKLKHNMIMLFIHLAVVHCTFYLNIVLCVIWLILL